MLNVDSDSWMNLVPEAALDDLMVRITWKSLSETLNFLEHEIANRTQQDLNREI